MTTNSVPAMVSMAAVIRHYSDRRGGQTALAWESGELTFRELGDRSSRVARALGEGGVSARDRVAYLDKNSPEFFELFYGCAKLGAVMTPLNWRLAQPELAAIIEDAGAAILIAGAEFAAVAEWLQATVGCLQQVLVVGHDGPNGGFEAWRDRSDPVDPGHEGAPSDVVLQLYTSGTTGLPKGVMVSESNLLALASTGWSMLGMSSDSVNLVPMPLFHIGGSGYATIGIFAGAQTVLVRQADAGEMLRTVSDRGVTHTFVVPAVLAAMLDAVDAGTDSSLGSLEVVCYGASPIAETILSRAMATLGCRFMQVYGLTETTGTVTLLEDSDHRSALEGRHPERLRSAGRAVPGAELRIVGSGSSHPLGPGQVGEIWIRSPQNTVGYWRKPQETAAALDPQGWLRTGDAGYLDAEGYLFIHDRVKDMIITGGENVYPAEVENILMAHPGVADVAVIGVPSDRWGETVLAVVVARPGEAPDADAVIGFARSRLAHYKCPTGVEFVESLPRNASGKVLKRDLRAPYWSDRRRSVG